MPSKTIAARAFPLSVSSQNHYNFVAHARAQRGVTLIELMVGIAIGLLVIAVAMGALMVSRGVSGTISDASNIQQQAALAMRTIGMQLRQAGSLRLNLDPGTTVTESQYMVPVAFEATLPPQANPMDSFDPATNTLRGTETPVTLTVGFRRYTEPVFTNTAEQSLARNCLGGPSDASTTTDLRLESVFELNGSDLRCSGNGADPQPIVQNVANFQVRYLLQDNATTPGISTIARVDADAIDDSAGKTWAHVQAIEVCLVLYGTEAIDLPTGSNYTDCDGTLKDMSALTGPRARRIHVAYRNIFQLRSQGLIGSVL
jgi:type IV pilus assembly protein PilW